MPSRSLSLLSTCSKAPHILPFDSMSTMQTADTMSAVSTHTLEFEVEAETMWGQRVAVCGSIPELGEWDPARSFVLSAETYPVWHGTLTVGLEPVSFSYVLVHLDPKGGPNRLIRWEQGERRDLKTAIGGRTAVRHRFNEPSWGTIETIANAQTMATFSLLPSKADAESVQPVWSEHHPVLLGNVGPSADDTLLKSLVAEEAILDSQRLRKRRLSFSRCVTSTQSNGFHHTYEAFNAKVLGRGGMSGSVYVAVRRKDSIEVAVKELPVKHAMQRRQVINEVRNQLSLDHPNICNLLQVFEEPSRLYLVMERLRGPDLHDYWRERRRLSEPEAAKFLQQMSNALEYCHSAGICHRDVKLENICMDKMSPDACLKLIDFGLSVDITQEPVMTDIVGSLYYMAPEVWWRRYDEKCDLWSLGVIAKVLLDGRPPFKSNNEQMLRSLICKGIYNFKEQVSKDAQCFVSCLLEVDVARRLDAQAAASHQWLASFRQTQ